MKHRFRGLIQEILTEGVKFPYIDSVERDAAKIHANKPAVAVTGMRRTGKTTFLHQCRAKLKGGKLPERLVFINFDQPRFARLPPGALDGIPDIHRKSFLTTSNRVVTFFLDSLDTLPGWESLLDTLIEDPECNVFFSLTSPSALDHAAAASALDKCALVKLHPYSFREHLILHKHELPESPLSLRMPRSVDYGHLSAQFLETGGLPGAQQSEQDRRLDTYKDTVDLILLRDIIERNHVSNPTALRWLVQRLLAKPTGLFSITGLFTELQDQGIQVSRETLYSLLSYLQEASLIYSIPVATDSPKRRQVNPRKAYPADHGFLPVYDRHGSTQHGTALETAVFIELLRRGRQLSYVKTRNGRFVDFLVQNSGQSEELIQVCPSVNDPVLMKNKVRAIMEATKEHPKVKPVIITLETKRPVIKIPESIEVVPAWLWLGFSSSCGILHAEAFRGTD